MIELEKRELRVVVPVGFLLPEEQEVAVSVDHPDGSQLPIRLRLVPARPETVCASEPTPLVNAWPMRRRSVEDDGYPNYEYGGGD